MIYMLSKEMHALIHVNALKNGKKELIKQVIKMLLCFVFL